MAFGLAITLLSLAQVEGVVTEPRNIYPATILPTSSFGEEEEIFERQRYRATHIDRGSYNTPIFRPAPEPRTGAKGTSTSNQSPSESPTTYVATRYGESYNGRTTGCGSTYSSLDPTILAVSPAKYSAWVCGTKLTITNPRNGLSVSVMRVDSCPGCGSNHIDLSEAGIAALCGHPCDYLSGLIITEGWSE